MSNPSVKSNLGVVLFRIGTAGKLCLGLFFVILWLLVVPALSMAATVTVGGTVVTGPRTEADIKVSPVGGNTIVITLGGNEWADDVASLETKRNLLFDSLTAGSEASEWAKVITALKTTGAGAIVRNANNIEVTITLPATADYSITADQTITVNVPASLLQDSANPVTAPGSFTIKANRAAAITGTITKATTESDIATGGKTIIITLTNDTWVSDVASNTTRRDQLFNALEAGTEILEWAKVIDAMKAQANPATVVTRTSNTVVTITLPVTSSYDITNTQTITANLPVELLASGDPLVEPAPSFTISPDRTTAVLSGTFITAPTEANVQAGTRTIIITLGGNQWADDVASLKSKRDLLFDSLIAGSESSEWAKVVTALKNAGSLARTSNTVITITLPAVATYNITADQKITLNIPSTLLLDANSPITSTLSFTISAGIAATISGTILDNTSEADIVAGGKTIIITLTNDTWVPDVVSNTSKRDALLDGLVAAGGEMAQWTNVVNALKAVPDLGSVITRNSDTVVTITLPVSYGYNISSVQEVELTIAAALTVNLGADLVANPKFTITHATPTATLGGTVTEATSEQSIFSGGKTIIITLTDDIWASDVVTDKVKRDALFNGLRAGTEVNEWDKVIAALKGAADSNPASVLSRDSDTVVTITLPAVADYNIIANQIISLTVSNTILTVANDVVTALPNFTVTAVTPTATLTGSLLTAATEPNILAGGKTIIITLTDDIWVSDIVTTKAKREALFDNLAAGTEQSEWAKVIAELKATADSNPAKVIARTSDNVVTITLPATTNYNIIADQVITLTIPVAPTSVLVSASAAVIASPTITIAPITAVLTGTAITSPVGKNDIITGGKTIIITLINDTWVSDIVSNITKRDGLIDGLAAGTAGAEWGKVITALKNSSTSVVRTSNNVVRITLPVTPEYNITADQTITLTVPSTALSSGGGLVTASPTFTIQLSTAVTAAISGTVTSAPLPTEADIIAGGRTIIITLTNDTWATDVASNTSKRTALLNALTSASESKEWKKVVTALKASPIALLRTSDTVVTITLPTCSDYNIAADQVVSLTIPRTVLTKATANVIASNTFTISPVNPTAAITGTITTATETDIFEGGSTIIITLTDDTWASDVTSNATKRNALLSGMVASTEDKEWKKVITALKAAPSAVERTSDTIITITLPAVNTYNITADQTLTLSIPASALTLGSSTVVAVPSLTISEESAGASLSGTMTTETITAADIVKGGKTIEITLTNNTWVSDVASTKTKRDALINGLVTASTDSGQWAKVITALKNNPNNVNRVSKNEVIITLPPTPGYVISSDEIVRLTIPKNLLGINTSNLAGNPKLTIKPGGTAVLGGTMISVPPTEANILAGGKTLTVTLNNDTWVADISSDITKRNALFAGLIASNQTSEWAKVVTALQTAGATAITRTSDTVVTITLPAVAGYSITDQQIITLTIPKSALTLTKADVQAAPSLSIRVQMGDLLANDAKLAQLLSNYSLRQIQVTVPPKYINKVQVNHFPIDTKYITSIDILCESNVARVTATTAGPVTHETTSYILSSGKRLFNIGFSGLTAPGDISLTIYDSYGAQPQAPITVQYVEGLSNPVQPPASDLRGTYTLYELSLNNTLFNSILGAYELNELIISTITE